MKLFKIIFVIVVLTFVNSFAQQRWLKGNLHTHSLWSDGDNFPELIMDWYKQNGYDFVALSDHNILAEGEKWIRIDNSLLTAYSSYKNKYDSNWIEEKLSGDTIFVRLKTLEEYRVLFEEPGKFLIIRSEEISDRFEKKPIHINATNIQELIEPQGGGSVYEVMQNNVDAINEQRERTGEPIMPHINHPNFIWAISAEDLIKLEGDKFFEIYNGHPLVNNEGDSIHPGTERMWDLVLSERLLHGKEIMYGIAVDDAHNYFEFGSNKSNPGRGWVMVNADLLTPESIIEAMEEGNFYASTGVEIKEIIRKKNSLKILVNPEKNIDYKIKFIGTKKDFKYQSEIGIDLKELNGIEAEYFYEEDDLYIRAEVISSKKKENPYKEGEYEKAWVQPEILNKK
jgi:hypothetical protein